MFIRVDGSGRPPLAPLYFGPFLVLERYRSSYKLQVGTRQEVVNISRLKPAFTPEDAELAQPPKQGRPRKQQPSEVPPPAAKRARGHPPKPAKPSGLGRPPSFVQASPTAVPDCRTRSGRTFAILPLVAVWGGRSVEDDVSQIPQFHDSFPPSVESYRYEDNAVS